MRSAKYCPVCEKVYGLSRNYCPKCEGVLLVRVWDYGKGFLIFRTEEEVDEDEQPGL